jgi:hypothetical protein
MFSIFEVSSSPFSLKGKGKREKRDYQGDGRGDEGGGL